MFKMNEMSKEIPQSHNLQPTYGNMKKIHITLTVSRHQEDNEIKQPSLSLSLSLSLSSRWSRSYKDH